MSATKRINGVIPVFVFGSNEGGCHGCGTALWAKQRRRAIQGVGSGIQGNSYAIPTKDENFRVLSLERIRVYIECFLKYAASHGGGRQYWVSPIGCGNAGYSPEDIAPMFADRPPNVHLNEQFMEALNG